MENNDVSPHTPDTPPPVTQAPPPPPPPVPPYRPAPRPAPRPSRGGGGWGWVILVIALVVVLGGGLLLALVGGLAALSPGGTMASDPGSQMEEVVVKNNYSENKILVLPVEGVISGMALDGAGRSMVDYIKLQLVRAGLDDQVKAVLLKVDSPGGEVLASDDINQAISDFQKKYEKPVIAVMNSMAASGGYYVSAPCQWIVAHELTITGSIGVIMHGYNYRGLMDKVGVRPEVFKSGKFKDMLSGDRLPEQITEEERQMVQDLVNEAFGRFKKVVSDGRKQAAEANKQDGKELAGNWMDYADGRVLTGRQALEHGFVDELGNFDDAVARARKIARVNDANLIRYQRMFDIGSLFNLFSKSEKTVVKVDLGFDSPKLQAGRLYFLPGYMFQ